MGRWYADLPFFSKADLEMVSGADTWLDLIAQGESKVELFLSTTPFPGSELIVKTEDTPEIGGAKYLAKTYHGVSYDLVMWLCEVTRHVFDELPDKIYYS